VAKAKTKKPEYECTECGDEFSSPRYDGCGGDESLRHKIEPKTFYSRNNSLIICWKEDRRFTDKAGNFNYIPGSDARFIGGAFTTSDPECQEVLTRKGYLLSREKYEHIRLTPELREARLKATVEQQRGLLEASQARVEELEAEKAGSKPKRKRKPNAVPAPA